MHVRRFAYDFIYQIYRFISFSNFVAVLLLLLFIIRCDIHWLHRCARILWLIIQSTEYAYTHTPPSHHTKMALKLAIEIYSHTKAFVVTHDVLHCVVPLFLKSFFFVSSLFCFSTLLQNSVFVVFLTFSLTHLIRPTE